VKQRSVARLGKRAAPEREDHTRVPFRCPAKHACKTFMFDVAKNRFALLVEDLRNRRSGVSFDFGVKVDKVPGELGGQEAPHGALPEPMKPVRHTKRHSGAGPVTDFFGWK